MFEVQSDTRLQKKKIPKQKGRSGGGEWLCQPPKSTLGLREYAGEIEGKGK